jgi:multidrug efflux system membrane fusion protein
MQETCGGRTARSRLAARALAAAAAAAPASAWALAVALVLAAASALAACAPPAPARSGGQDAVPVTLAVAARKDVPVRLGAIGTVQAFETVAIKAQIGGTLQDVHFKEGQDVRQGDLLFRIDPRPYEAALEQAKAKLARDTIDRETARKDAARYVDLVTKDYVTQEEYDAIRSKADGLEATVRADEAELQNATVQLEYCTIRAPIDGRTGQLMMHAGNLVKANADTPMVVINRIDPIYVSFTVPEQDLEEIKARRQAGVLEVEASIQGTGTRTLSGRLSFIDNAIDRTTGTVLLKGTFANRERLLWPGQFVDVSLTLSTRKDATVVPTPAVQTGQQGPFVFVVRSDKTVESHPVVVGLALGPESVIDKGVQPGEIVVTDGQIRLVPGTRIEEKGAAAAASAAGAPADSGAGAEKRP